MSLGARIALGLLAWMALAIAVGLLLGPYLARRSPPE
jgi:uncharacterized protein YneF (UPF0154 family)